MRIHVNPKEVLRGLQMAKRAVADRYITPMLQNVKMTAEKSGAFLTATNTELSIQVRLPCRVVQKGMALLPVTRLEKMLKLAKDESVTLESTATGIALVATGKRAELVVEHDPADFPVMVEFPSRGYFTVGAPELREAIRQTSFAMAKNDYGKYSFTGVCFSSLGAKTLDVVATNGRRLAWQQVDMSAKRPSIRESIVPAPAVALLSKMLADSAGDVGVCLVAFDGKRKSVMFQNGDITLFSRLTSGEFPAWREIVQDGCEKQSVQLLSGDLLSALRRASICTSLNKPAVRLAFTGDRLIVESGFSVTVHGVGERFHTDAVVESGSARITIPVTMSFNHRRRVSQCRNRQRLLASRSRLASRKRKCRQKT